MAVASDARRRNVFADEGGVVSVGRVTVMRGADGLDVWWRRIGRSPSFSVVVALSLLMVALQVSRGRSRRHCGSSSRLGIGLLGPAEVPRWKILLNDVMMTAQTKIDRKKSSQSKDEGE